MKKRQHKKMDMDVDLLWQKFLLGDDESFDRLYSRYVQILFVYGLQFTADRELVKDCIQDIFVKMYDTKTELHHVDNVNTYLRIALKNKIINSFKREKIRTKYIDTLDFSDIDDFTPEQQIERLEEDEQNRVRIERILKLLTPQQKKVVQFRYIEELSLEEISNLMKINYQSVQNILQRSIKKIKNHFIR